MPVLAAVAAVVAIVGTAKNIQAQNEARATAAASADEQRKAQSEQNAVRAAQQANDRRAQVREERVRRARILQGSENSGTTGSSGEAGAVGSISTQYFANTGSLLGGAQASANISTFQQNAANFNYSTQKSSQEASIYGQAGQLAGNIFEQAGKIRDIFPVSADTSSNPTMNTSDYLAIRDQ